MLTYEVDLQTSQIITNIAEFNCGSLRLDWLQHNSMCDAHILLEDAVLMQRVILKEVEGMNKGRKVRYRALDPLVRVFGFRKILEQWPELPSVLIDLLLDDPMLGPVVGATL